MREIKRATKKDLRNYIEKLASQNKELKAVNEELRKTIEVKVASDECRGSFCEVCENFMGRAANGKIVCSVYDKIPCSSFKHADNSSCGYVTAYPPGVMYDEH